jgi:ATP-dependent DNA ligase
VEWQRWGCTSGCGNDRRVPTRGYELKLDGYRAIAFDIQGRVHLRSRNDKDFAERYPAVMRGLAKLPDDTVIDGELVAFDEAGCPSFNRLQNTGSSPVLRQQRSRSVVCAR